MGKRVTDWYKGLDNKVKLAFISTMILGMMIHIYKFTNTLPNHDSLYNYYDSLLRVCDNDTISWQRRLYVGHKFAEPIDNQLYDSIVRLGNETYFDTIHYQTNIFGCDSIHYLRLQIQSTDTIFQTAELCATDSLIFDSVTYYFDSIQTDTVIIFNTAKMSSLGCDSIVQLTASVHPIYTFVEYDTVFQYDPYVWLTHEGHDYYIDDKKYRDIPTTVAGEFLITDYLQSQYGCDSTHYLHLFVAPTYQFDTTMYICDNDTVSWHNILYIGIAHQTKQENKTHL